MSKYIKFDSDDVQAIIGLVSEIEPAERTAREEKLLHKAVEISKLQAAAREKIRPTLYEDEVSKRLTIQYGDNVSPVTGYKEVTRVGNVFAVTDYWKGVFPTRTLLRFFYENPSERQQEDSSNG